MLRIIATLLAFSISVTHAQSVQELVDRYDRAFAQERYGLALSAAEDILENYPDSAWWHFQAGAALAELGRDEEAVASLTRCADLGFSGVRSFEQHRSLDPLREHDGFIRAIERVRSNAEVRMSAFQEEARQHTPRHYVPERSDDAGRPGLILALHGTGMDGASMYDSLRETAEDAGMVLVCPDALRPAGDGFSWTYRDEAEWFVEHLIEWAVQEHGVDAGRVLLVGFSQGANIALILGQTRPELFRGVIPVCGHYEAQVVASPREPAPFYLLTGARDPQRRTYTEARRALLDAGGAAQLRVLSGHGHELPSGRVALREFKRALVWVDRQEE